MSQYDNNFPVPGLSSARCFTSTVMGTKLWYFYVDSTSSSISQLKRVTFGIPGYVDAEAFQNPDAWAQPALVEVPQLRGYVDAIASGEPPDTQPIDYPGSMVAVTLGATIYLLWTDSGGRIHGTRSAGDDSWEPQFTLDVAAYPARTDATTALTAYVLGDRLVVTWFSVASNQNRCVVTASFLPEDIRPASAQSTSGLAWPATATPIELTAWNTANRGINVSARCTVVPSLDGGDSNAYVFVVGETESMRLLSVYRCDLTTGLAEPSSVVLSESLEFTNVSLDLDASNTVYLYGLDSGRSSLCRVPLMNSAGTPELGSEQAVDVGGGTLWSIASPVVISYVAGSQRTGSLQTTSEPGSSTLETVEAPLYRFMFYRLSNDAQPEVAVLFYGDRHLVATVNDLYVNDAQNPDAKTQAMAAKGIIDGPLPVPGQNLRMMSQGGTVAPWDVFKPIARVTYGTNAEDDLTHEVTVKGTVGGSVSVEGSAGIDWESDLSGSVGLSIGFEASLSVSTTGTKVVEMLGASLAYSHANSSEKLLRKGEFQAREANVTGLTRVVPQSDAFVIPSEDAPPVISDQGVVVGGALSVVNLAVAFVPAGAADVLPARPSTITFMPTTRVQLASSYSATYAFTPGNLWSQTPDGDGSTIQGINQRMAAAYTTWKAANPNAADPFGDAYNDYVAQVLDRSGLRIGVGGRPYLEFSVSNHGMIQAHYELGRYSFEEWGTVVDNEFYAAGTWENVVNLAGWELKSYLEAGGSYDFSTGYHETTEHSSKWGISAEMTNFPEATHAGDISSYTFRLYLLPADNRWVQELICFSDYAGPKPLDPNSRPWKIMFVVQPDSITEYTPPT